MNGICVCELIVRSEDLAFFCFLFFFPSTFFGSCSAWIFCDFGYKDEERDA